MLVTNGNDCVLSPTPFNSILGVVQPAPPGDDAPQEVDYVGLNDLVAVLLNHERCGGPP